MSELEEFDLHPEPGEPLSGPPEDRTFAIAILAAVLVAGAGIAGYLTYRSRSAPAPSPTAARPRATLTPIPGPEAFGLPSLDQSDDFVRELARGLSSHPQLGLWLAQQGLVRLFVNAVESVAKSESPRATLGFLAPKGSFLTAQSKGRVVIDAKSYARYDVFAEAVASLDATKSAAAFRRTLPLLEAAYRELGYPKGGFERTLREAITHLLATPVAEADVAVKPVRRGNLLVYEYADPSLEALSPAQKHLLRMGPANMRRIQESLRGFVTALGS